jgi:predicted kinase
MRGPSGSGKSTWVDEHYGNEDSNAAILSVDDYFTDNDGTYSFDVTRLAEMHVRCFISFLRLVEMNHSLIVLDNINTRNWHYAHYVWIAAGHGYEVEVVEFRMDTLEKIKVCLERNKHNIDFPTLCHQAVNFESLEEGKQEGLFPDVADIVLKLSDDELQE